MPRTKTDPTIKLTHKVTIHLSQAYFKKLEGWLSHSNCQTLSELARSILYKEQINWYHKDASLESVAVELALVRKELNAMGRNINQITHFFHLTEDTSKKMFQALKIAEEYRKVGVKVEELVKMITPVSKSWLQK